MRAMVLAKAGEPLHSRDLPRPTIAPGQLLVRVHTCAICRTDLHIIDGDLTEPKLPLVPGHQIVGHIEEVGAGVTDFSVGERVGIPWLGWTCGECRYCKSGRENLCDLARFTGYTIDGGYAELTVADARFCFRIPELYDDVAAAPLLCAGVIGYRSLRKAGDAERIGLYGFGNAATLIAQVARAEGRDVFAFTRPNDLQTQHAARELGASWAGGSDQTPPKKVDAAIIFASVGALVPMALCALAKGGRVICGGIHMSDIPSLAYRDLWEERSIASVANLTREDASEFLEIARHVPLQVKTETFPLDRANEAIARFRRGELTGTAVLVM